MPAFGQADLSNCEREQIHLAGSIQPHGALILVRQTDKMIVQASANLEAFLGTDGDVLGRPLDCLGDNLVRQIAALPLDTLHSTPIAFRCPIGSSSTEFDVLVHAPPDGGLIIEFERAAAAEDLTQAVEKALHTIAGAASLRALCEEAASIYKEMIGYDRVMLYRFDEDGHGEVYSERREPHLEAYLGNRYPASDIPQIARRLYERTRVRMLVDVHYEPVPLEPRLSPITNRDLDMSLCFLRSMSPIHIQYLRNMGVNATLVASLVVGGKLWGLVACHHYSPRNIPFESRAACELLAEAVSIRIAALESFAQAQAELSVRRLEQRMIEAISQDGDWRTALFDNAQSLLQPVGANGAALLFEGEVLTAGEVPGTPQLREIAAWLDSKPRQPVFVTSSLGFDEPSLAAMTSVASGLAAAPVSNSPGEYLLWFRAERIRTVTWGGDPLEPVLIGDNPADLSPRRSFAKWHQLVEGRSEPWSPADVTAARLIGETLADVVIQFRSMQMLIARDQLDKVTQQVEISELPVIVADPQGRILVGNRSFQSLLPRDHGAFEWLEELAKLFSDQGEARRRLRDLVNLRRTWRGEISMLASDGGTRSILVRGDPVFASPDRVLGIVLLFTDVADRNAAEAASRNFQEGILQRPRHAAGGLGNNADILYQKLMSPVLENAQLAALEITDGFDKSRTTRLLDSVRASVDRSAEVIDRLLRHAMPAARTRSKKR
jgi:light-regulated signal transduction histidine kinase (bacteriophytochrome)